jgi:Complex 1 protein (LYR family)
MPPNLWIPTAKQSLKHFSASNTRKEALSLYREILRTAKAFHWVDDSTGLHWNHRLKSEARKEFEASKDETDPLIIARMLVTGRDCVQQIQNKFAEADRATWARIERERER